MTKFLKLTNYIFNTNIIHKIVIYPNKYIIHIATNQISGFNWGISGFGLGNISSDAYEVEVCQTAHSTDYKLVSDWIDKQ